MIPNGKEMNWNGHKLVFESEPGVCRGCFFADKNECPDCDEGLWVEEPSVWLYKPDVYGEGVYECSACGEPYILDDTPTAHNYHFCPNCGAKMEGVKEASK